MNRDLKFGGYLLSFCGALRKEFPKIQVLNFVYKKLHTHEIAGFPLVSNNIVLIASFFFACNFKRVGFLKLLATYFVFLSKSTS